MPAIIPSHEQSAVIGSNESLICILACAGSGKTYTITKRIAHLVDDLKIDPSKVIAITFTVMAAEKLKYELTNELKNKHASSQMFVGTIHAFCFNILKQAFKNDIDESRILSENQQFILLNRFWSAWEIAKISPHLTKAHLIERLAPTFNIIKMEFVDQVLLKERHPDIFRVFSLYNEFLRDNSYFDYADLIYAAVDKLENSAAFKKELTDKYQWVFVDEYQDVDPLQARLISIFREKGHLCVVGDDDQSIYQFRGTDVRNILDFTKLPDSHTYVLSQNRRCAVNVLALAQNCIDKIPDRFPKTMSGIIPAGLVVCQQFPSVQDEIKFIVDEIKRIYSSKEVATYGDIAILMRSVSSYGKGYISALKQANIPCVARGGKTLFDTDEISKIVAVLKWFTDESNAISGLNAIRQVFIGPVSAEGHDLAVDTLSKEEAKKIGLSVADFGLIKTLNAFKDKYYAAKYASLLELVLEVITCLGLIRLSNGESVAVNVAQLTQIIGEYEAVANSKKMGPLCSYLETYAQKAYDEAVPAGASREAVNILTIHQAKGLEFDFVFIPMLVELRFPVSNSQNRWLIDDTLFQAGRYYSTEPNERRLFYVASTRARKGLFLLCSKDVGLRNTKLPSIFFNEARKVKLPAQNAPPQLQSKTLVIDTILVSSYSELEYYLTCPLRYKLLIQYNIASPPNPFFQFGKLIHAVVARINQSFQNGHGIQFAEAEAYYNSIFDTYMKHSNVPHYVITSQKIRGLKSLKNYYSQKASWFDHIYGVECNFEYITHKSLINGRYDLLVKTSADNLEVVDFKTGHPHDYLRTDFQMQVYSLAGIEQLQLPVKKATLYYIEPGEEVTYIVDSQFLKEGTNNLKGIISGINARSFNPIRGQACTRCEVRRICDQYLS